MSVWGIEYVVQRCVVCKFPESGCMCGLQLVKSYERLIVARIFRIAFRYLRPISVCDGVGRIQIP